MLAKEVLEWDKPSVTIIPLIISSNKTQLTNFCNKSAYPVYLMIGNIPKEICCKLSSHAYMLIGYLPTTHLQHVTNASAQCHLIVNLYHACMHRIFSSVQAASRNGAFMISGQGITYHTHPLLTYIVGDYLSRSGHRVNVQRQLRNTGVEKFSTSNFKVTVYKK
jgi:Plavaka transposase